MSQERQDIHLSLLFKISTIKKFKNSYINDDNDGSRILDKLFLKVKAKALNVMLYPDFLSENA